MKHTISFLFLGAALFITGWVIRYKIGERKFKRRGMAGLEYFPSYRFALVTRFLEGVAGAIAKICMVVGMALVIYYFL